MAKTFLHFFAPALILALTLSSSAFATPIVAGLDDRTAITPPSGAQAVSNILDLCSAVDGVFNHLAGDEACDDVFSSSDTSLTFSEFISLAEGMNLRLSGLNLTYVDGPFSMFSFDGGTLVVSSGTYASDRGCIFNLRDRNDFSSPFNETTDELQILGGTFEYTGSASGDYAASPICIMTGYKNAQLSLNYAKLYLPENYVFVNADTGEELTVDDVKLGLVSINKDSPTSVYYLNARRITIAYHEPKPDEPTDPTPDEPADSTPDNPTPSDDTPSDTEPDNPATVEVVPISSTTTPKTPDTSGGSCETFLEPILASRISSTSFYLIVALCLTTYTLMIVIFTTLAKIHQGLKP